MYVFPDAPILRNCVYNGLNDNLSEDGLGHTISVLVANSFANLGLVERGIELKLRLLIANLKIGQDGHTGAKFEPYQLPEYLWNFIKMDLERTLKECAHFNEDANVQNTVDVH